MGFGFLSISVKPTPTMLPSKAHTHNRSVKPPPSKTSPPLPLKKKAKSKTTTTTRKESKQTHTHTNKTTAHPQSPPEVSPPGSGQVHKRALEGVAAWRGTRRKAPVACWKDGEAAGNFEQTKQQITFLPSWWSGACMGLYSHCRTKWVCGAQLGKSRCHMSPNGFILCERKGIVTFALV